MRPFRFVLGFASLAILINAQDTPITGVLANPQSVASTKGFKMYAFVPRDASNVARQDHQGSEGEQLDAGTVGCGVRKIEELNEEIRLGTVGKELSKAKVEGIRVRKKR